jgi:hypothetical protein
MPATLISIEHKFFKIQFTISTLNACNSYYIHRTQILQNPIHNIYTQCLQLLYPLNTNSSKSNSQHLLSQCRIMITLSHMNPDLKSQIDMHICTSKETPNKYHPTRVPNNKICVHLIFHSSESAGCMLCISQTSTNTSTQEKGKAKSWLCAKSWTQFDAVHHVRVVPKRNFMLLSNVVLDVVKQ